MVKNLLIGFSLVIILACNPSKNQIVGCGDNVKFTRRVAVSTPERQGACILRDVGIDSSSVDMYCNCIILDIP